MDVTCDGTADSTIGGDNSYENCLTACDNDATCNYFAYSNSECKLYSTCATTTAAADHVLYEFVEERFKLTEAEYNALAYKAGSLDELIMTISRGHKNFMETRCVGGAPDFYKSTSSKIVSDVLENYPPNFKSWGASIVGDELVLNSDSHIETLTSSDVPLNAIERQSRTSGGNDVEVFLEYCHNKCTENDNCGGIVVQETTTGGDGLIDSVVGLQCHSFTTYDTTSADWNRLGCATCVTYIKPQNTVQYSNILTNSDIVSPKKETDNLRHEFQELPVVFDFEIERYPIAIRRMSYQTPQTLSQPKYVTAHQYKTIKDLGGTHPHVTMCLDTHSVDMKVYKEDTDFITAAICDIDKTGSFKQVGFETVETYSDRIFILPELFTSPTGFTVDGTLPTEQVVTFTFIAELHPEWRATNQDTPSGRRLRQLEEIVLNPDEIYLISVQTTYTYDTTSGNFTNVEGTTSVLIVKSESAEFEKWILDHYDIGYTGGLIVFIAQIGLIAAGLFYFTLKKNILDYEKMGDESDLMKMLMKVLYVAYKIVVLTFITQIIFTREEWNNTYFEDSVWGGILWSVIFPAVYCIVEAVYIKMIKNGKPTEGETDGSKLTSLKTPAVSKVSDLWLSQRAWGGEITGLAVYIATFVILEAKSKIDTTQAHHDWLKNTYPGEENVWQYFVFPLTFALLLGMLRVISTINGWYEKTWTEIVMDFWGALISNEDRQVVLYNYELLLTVVGHVLLFVILGYPIDKDDDTAIVLTVLWGVYTLLVVIIAARTPDFEGKSANIVSALVSMLPIFNRERA